MELAIESAETLFAGDAGAVTAKDLDGDDDRVLHQVVVHHAVADDGGTVVGAGSKERVSRMETDLREERGGK